VQEFFYSTQYFYFLYWLNLSEGEFFKVAVISRFITIMRKRVLFINHVYATSYLYSVNSIIKSFFLSLFFPFKRRLKFHGLAFGINFDKSERILSLNVGYTSTPVFLLPSYIERIQLSNSCRRASFEGRKLSMVASFVTMLRDVRPVSIYFNPAKRGGRRGIRLYLTYVRRKKFKKDVK